MSTESGGRIRTKHRAEQRERDTLEKSGPCIETDVLTEARCSEDNKHVGDKREPLVKTLSQFSFSHFRHLAICPTTFGLYFCTHFTALLYLKSYVRSENGLYFDRGPRTARKLELITKQRREKLTQIPLRGRLSCICILAQRWY